MPCEDVMDELSARARVSAAVKSLTAFMASGVDLICACVTQFPLAPQMGWMDAVCAKGRGWGCGGMVGAMFGFGGDRDGG